MQILKTKMNSSIKKLHDKVIDLALESVSQESYLDTLYYMIDLINDPLSIKNELNISIKNKVKFKYEN